MAHKLLCETPQTVTDICHKVGFNSIQTFNRAFKDTFGMQPLVARESQAKITCRSVEEIVTGYLKRIAVEGEFSVEPRFEEREEFCSDPLSFYYMAGVEVEKDTPLPEGMYRKVIPKAKYAVFTVNGNNADGEIGKAFQYTYFVWLPNLEYSIDESTLLDFEYYDDAGTASLERRRWIFMSLSCEVKELN